MGQDPDLLPVFANKTLMEHSHPYVYTLSRCFHNTELKRPQQSCMACIVQNVTICLQEKVANPWYHKCKMVINPQRRESLGKGPF